MKVDVLLKDGSILVYENIRWISHPYQELLSLYEDENCEIDGYDPIHIKADVIENIFLEV